MFKKLKTKMIFVSSLVILIFLTLVVSFTNLINYKSIVKEADNLLQILSQNKGQFPDKNHPGNKDPNHFSPETPFESRYFSFEFNNSNVILKYDISKIASINYDQALEYSKVALSSDNSNGFIDEYRYNVHKTNKETIVVFLDCSNNLAGFYNFLISSIIISIICFLLFVGVLIILSNRIIRPFSMNYEKQKMFITDASHELKTPLTIINTNVDILEMEYGENESFSDIHNQINKLKDLTNNLVLLSKMEESKSSINLIEQPLSDIIIETITPFKNLAISQNKNIECNIQEMLSLKCDDKSIRQLINILLDNALKYSKENSSIVISLKKYHNSIIFSITNESLYQLNKDSLKHIFDRFYRPDSSRNSSTGGHGIGLSIAKAIVSSHNSKIQANIVDNNKFQIIISFNN